MKDKIVKLIQNAGDTFGNRLQRNVAVGSVLRNFQTEEDKNNLIKQIETDDSYADVKEVIYSDEVGVIFKQRPRKANDKWDNLYPYRVAVKTEKRGWKMLNTVCDTVDSAMVLLLATKKERQSMVEAVLHLLDIKVEEF